MFRFTRRALVVALAALLPMVAAQAQERSFKYALQNPKGHPLEIGASKFAELVAAKSGGKLKVTVYPGGTLGGDAANVSALQGGTIDFMALNLRHPGLAGQGFRGLRLPLHLCQPARGGCGGRWPLLGQKLHAKLADKGIVGLAYFELGFRNITSSRRAINTVEDLAGLKLRVIPNAINVDWVKAVGANPTPMAFPEVYAGMEQKAIDGQENPFSVILANKFYEVQKHLAVTNHQYNPQSLIMSRKVWDTLAADQKKLIQDAAIEAVRYERQVNRELAAGQLGELKKAGMQVTEFSTAEQAKLREKFKPVVEKHGAAIAATLAELQAELAKARK